MQKVYFIFFLALLSSTAYADSPPCWCKFEEESTNKKYIAIVDRPEKDSMIDPWKSVWTLSVYEKTEKGNRLMWKMNYDYTGYPGGLLSDDGKVFTYVEFWFYADIPLVDIYREGKKPNTSGLKGENFNIPKEKLARTVSHQLWLWKEGDATSYIYKNNKLCLKLRSIDGRIHYIDISNGKFIS